MAEQSAPAFRGGRNVAMKIPPDQYEATVAFYRDTLRLGVTSHGANSFVVDFGPIRLWLDRVATVSHAELWLEVEAASPEAAAETLEAAGVVRCDAIEPLPEGFGGFWIKNPASIVHLVAEPAGNER